MPAFIEFHVEYDEGLDEDVIVPVIERVALTDRIHAFERRKAMETRPASYGGLPLRNRDHYAIEPRRVALLACTCGEWGCWPLMARVVVTPDRVVWQDFEQPHRPERDYSGFGPFRFDRSRYGAALRRGLA